MGEYMPEGVMEGVQLVPGGGAANVELARVSVDAFGSGGEAGCGLSRG